MTLIIVIIVAISIITDIRIGDVIIDIVIVIKVYHILL